MKSNSLSKLLLGEPILHGNDGQKGLPTGWVDAGLRSSNTHYSRKSSGLCTFPRLVYIKKMKFKPDNVNLRRRKIRMLSNRKVAYGMDRASSAGPQYNTPVRSGLVPSEISDILDRKID